MKKSFYFLLFLFLGTYCYSQDVERLPIKTWEEIVEIDSYKHSQIKNWNSDIHIKLEGNYTIQDSLKVAEAVFKLDSLTDVISIDFSKKENSNFKIFFLDSLRTNETLGTIHSRSSNNSNGQLQSEIYVYNPKMISYENRKYGALEVRIAKELVGGYFAYGYNRKLARKHKRKSVFNPNNTSDSLNKEDMLIIKKVYNPLFFTELETAKHKYKYVLNQIEEKRNLSRDRSLWWVRNPIAVIFLPALILILFFISLIGKIKKVTDLKIKKHGLRFGIIAFIGLVFLWVVIVFSVSFYDFLTITHDYKKGSYVRFDTIITTAILLAMCFPFLYLFRYIEIKIQKLQKSIFTKTALIFLSTGFLPFVVAVMFYGLFISKGQISIDVGYLMLSKIFLYAMAIATARTLISYFIFKERNLVIENETKLSNLKALKAEAEVKLLQSQINPHFLYNSLNSIASLAPIDTGKTQKMAYALSDLFKYTINRQGKKMSTVKDEVTMVKNYLEIEKIRFGDRLNFRIEVDKTLEAVEIPLCLIQPLVENAVKHGISKNEGQGEITLNIEKTSDGICIEILDNGPSFPEGLVSGHGLQTVYDLLRLTYGENASLNWQNTPEKSISINITQTF